jgi:uncharacterized membrane protein YoaK (UPF0700 family)
MSWLAFLLAAIAGLVDVAGYIALGGVFTAHVSGDTVTAGVALVHGYWHVAGVRFAAIALFVVGYLIGGSIVKFSAIRKWAHWFSLGAWVEASFLALFALAHYLFAGSSTHYIPGGWELVALIACLACAMGTQNALLSNVEHFPVRTTFVTGMTVNFAHELLDLAAARLSGLPGDEHRRKVRLYATLWASFALGGCAGGYMLITLGATTFLLPSLAIAAIAAYAWWRPFTRIQPG